MPNIYVIDATVPRGGAYMAYHIGRLLHQKLGFNLFNVQLTNLHGNLFHYDTAMPQISLQQMEEKISHDDLLICNPSAASRQQFGLRLPGKKIMYVQGFNTYEYLDCHFDIYASVSTLVHDYLLNTYQINAPIIPPFISIPDNIQIRSWQDRPPHSALLYLKQESAEHVHVSNWLKHNLAVLYPELTFSEVPLNYQEPHAAFLQRVASVRYLLNISIAEGFGLVPLEAMALQTIPFGLDGLAGKDYMEYGGNSFCINYPALSYQSLHKMVTDMQSTSLSMAHHSAAAKAYSVAAFYEHWSRLLEQQLIY